MKKSAQQGTDLGYSFISDFRRLLIHGSPKTAFVVGHAGWGEADTDNGPLGQ